MTNFNKLNNQRIWITGASSGIGQATALELAQYNTKLILSGRNITALKALKEKIASDNTLVLPFDVNSKEEHFKAVQAIKKHFGGLDIAFFNAGINARVTLDTKSFDSEIFTRLMQTNYNAVVYGIEATLPLLKESKSPLIAATSSVASYAGLPYGEAYCATKAAVRVMLQGLRIDLIPQKIDVSVVCPGFIKTPMTDTNNFHMPFLISAEKAGKIITKGLANHTQEIHFPKRMSFLLKFFAMLPTPIYTKLLYHLKPKKP